MQIWALSQEIPNTVFLQTVGEATTLMKAILTISSIGVSAFLGKIGLIIYEVLPSEKPGWIALSPAFSGWLLNTKRLIELRLLNRKWGFICERSAFISVCAICCAKSLSTCFSCSRVKCVRAMANKAICPKKPSSTK